MTKSDLRTTLLDQRSAITPDDRGLWDQMIFERAHKHKAFQNASRVHVYRSFGHEVETTPFIEYAWGIGKDVYVPIVPPGIGVLHHCRVTWHTKWREGAFGIMEPVIEDGQNLVTDPSFFGDDSAIIVPLVGFDRQCHRLGYGKGYYDRFLADTTATAIGIAYEVQRVPSVGAQAHDVPLHCVATNERWYVPVRSA
jgi:5-formyltetrahydrofolate cyclo-ligase